MARIRTIKPEFPQSESMGNVSRDARLTFIMLWTLADDHGRLRGNSRMLASLLFPYDDDAGKGIEAWLGQLEKEGCILRYVADGTSYIQIVNWLSHQKVDKPSGSRIPACDDDSRILAKIREGSSEDQGSKDQGSRKGSKDRRSVTLDDLSAEHIAEWLAEKRKMGIYLYHDEKLILERFKDYCRSKGKTYRDYPAALRNAFEWDSCQPKGKYNAAAKRHGKFAEQDYLAGTEGFHVVG